MRTLLYIILLSVGLVVFAENSSTQEPDANLHNKCIYPTLMVFSEEGSCGTGFIVKSTKVKDNLYCNIFFTCSHVVKNKEHYSVTLYEYEKWSKIKSEKVFSAIIYAQNTQADIAIGLFLSEKQLKTVTLDFDPKLYIASSVYRIGCGLGDDPRYDEGKITAVRTNMGSLKQVIRTSIGTVPGDSGSPVFQNYKVIGLTQSIRNWKVPVFHMSYIIPLDRYQDWDKASKGAINFAWADQPLPTMTMWELNLNHEWENLNPH